MRYLWITWFTTLAIALAGCSAPGATPQGTVSVKPLEPLTLTVMAAGSLTEAFTELGQQFQQENAHVTVQFNFAGSQQLAQQLAEGAPADVYASANAKQMSAVVDAGRIDDAAPRVFARNRLVVIVPAANPAGIAALADLAKPGLKLVLAAKEVPVGQYSLDFLDKTAADPAFEAGFREAVMANVVSYEENVKSVLAKVALGEADAGIVYTSDAGEGVSGQVARIDIPDSLNVIAAYPIAVVRDSAQSEAAQAFLDLVFSAAGQAILSRHGLLPPE
jgi:molybdate transport system substrate-binding protein